LTALDFKSLENGGTLIIKTNKPVTYNTRRNMQNHQFIVELANTSVPKKFQRPLVTKEFPGILATIQAYQSKSSENMTRIVLQMKGPMDPASEPSVVQSGNVIRVAASGISAVAASDEPSSPSSTPAGGANFPAMSEESEEGEMPSQQAADTVASQPSDQRIMNNKSFEDFLMGQTKFYGHPISIEVNNQDVREVFKFISDESGLNILLDEGVKGKVTMKLRQVPWDQALAIILQSNQLGYVKSGSILRIATLATIQAESTAAKRVIDSQKDLAPLRIQLFPLSYAKTDEITSQVQNLLSPRGKVSSDKRTNTLIVTDIAEHLAKVKSLLTKLDTQTPQVLIEAKVAEVTDSFSKAFGVNWQAGPGSIQVGQGAGRQNIDLSNSYTSSYLTNGSSVLSLSLSNLDVVGNLSSTLTWAEQNNLARLISSPRIVVLDRTSATISQTTKYPYSSVTISNGAVTTTAQFQDIKLELGVKPQITADGGVLMDLTIQRDLIGSQISIGGSSVPAVDTRSAKTQVLVDNADTVMIGGIYQSDVQDLESGVPLLKDIPLIGALFKYKSHSKQKNELVLFMTPRILNREKSFVKGLESAMLWERHVG
jgi:type IV pilus assembly protein PilQ